MKIQTLGLSPSQTRSSDSSSQMLPGPQPLTAGNWSMLFGEHSTDAGEVVNEQTALAVSEVFAAVRVLADSISSLPLPLYKRTPQGRVRAIDHPLHYLLTVAPNDEMQAATFFHVLVTSMALCGNAYAELERNASGQVVGIWPLNPNATTPIRVNGRLAYRCSDGMSAGIFRTIASADILHIPLFPSFDGVVGLSPLHLHRQAIGLSRAVERFASRFFRNYATPAIALATDKLIKPEGKQQLRLDWEQLQTGHNQHRVAVLDQGLKIERIGANASESQQLETRRFLREQVAGIYGVPVHMLGDNQRLSQASAEQLSLSFVQDTLLPYTARISGEITRKLLKPSPGQAAEFLVDFDLSARLKRDLAASTTYYKTAIQFGWMCPNDVRRELNLNEGPDALNVFQTPVNMMNSERLLDPSKPGTLPVPTEEVMNE